MSIWRASTFLLVGVVIVLSGSGTRPPLAAGAVGASPRLLLYEPVARGWSVVDVDRGVRVRVLHANYWDMRRSADGSRVAFPCRTLCIARLGNGALTRVPNRGFGNAISPSWSPNGALLAFIAESASFVRLGLWTAHADGTHPRRVVAATVYAPSWSPSGLSIAYSVHTREGSAISIVRKNGQTTKLATVHGTFMPSPRWSPHGSLIAYLEGTGSPSPGIYIVREGRSPRRIVPLAQTTEWPQVERTINWSADGTLVAYDTHGAAFEVDVKTGRRRTLDATQARFAPDGRDMLLLAEAKASAATGIYRARLIFLSAGRHRRIPIADGVMGDLFAYIDWSPDGTQAAFLKQNGLWIADLPARTTHQVLRWNLPGTQYKGPLIWARPGIP